CGGSVPGVYTRVKSMRSWINSCMANQNTCSRRLFALDMNPRGNLEGSGCTASAGWTCDPSNYDQPLAVDFYADAPAGQGGAYLGRTTANVSREQAVRDQCGQRSGHGFIFKTPASLSDGVQHSIYAYAINTGTGSKNPLLSSSPKYITCGSPPIADPLFPTASIFGSTLTTVGQVLNYSVNADDAGNNLYRIGIYVTPTNVQSWTLLKNCEFAPTNKGTCSTNWVPASPGTYYVVADATDTLNQHCTGNPWEKGVVGGIQAKDCGPNDLLTVTVNPVTIPAAPTVVSYTKPSPTSVRLTWQDNAVNEDGFHVYRKKFFSSGWGNWVLIATKPPNSQANLNESLGGGTYRYGVKAFNSAGESSHTTFTNNIVEVKI
ncbi:MAG: fibronectin type III domain-containing protein, partial [Nitrososphaera sp.]|nr:fibronectin type III domain-containing protein [Nitrososphaera sp.]